MKGQGKTDASNERWGDLKEPPSAGRPTLEEGGFVNGAVNVGSFRGRSRTRLGEGDDEYDCGSLCGGEARVTARGTLED